MTHRACNWSVTINNPTDGDEEHIATARQKGWKVEGQLEKGENGTPHYQLLVKTPQVRFSAMKKQFPRAHIEEARNVTALTQYVHKDDTREGQLKTEQNKYPSLAKFWSLMYQYFIDSNYIDVCWEGKWFEKETQGRDTMDLFDEAVDYLIRQGYFVEGIAINPQVRGSFKRYWSAILFRSEGCRQTDRQTDESIIAVKDITNALEERNDKVEDEGERQEQGEGRITRF